MSHDRSFSGGGCGVSETWLGAPSARPGRRRRGVTLADVSALTFAHEPDAARYTLRRGNDLVSILDYHDNGTQIAMTRAYTIPTFRGHGYAAEIVDRAVAQLEREGGRTVIPVCWYVADWFDEHPERAGILQPRAKV
jgi:uncharacterized protein